ncbi:MAG: threonine/serine exporter family protein [Caloramator sp.]|uniref:threonine/serine exporter family protein n=1 Tax=Caloramator sp. TaxID=1871330 RepID=UPI001D670B4C|nr:threonine/serine exporter family protein [Caloramator sp.]MBZ4663341.1 threonine/serine exporter family protein [Caloramator sp.]
MNIKEVMDIASFSGEILLSSGAEIYRVEDTITRICNTYGVHCECFVMPTGFSLTVRNKNGDVLSNVKRIRQRSVDLHRVEMVNTFSRRLLNERASYKEAMEELNRIKNMPYFSYNLQIISSGFVAFGFAKLFGGSFLDSLVAFVISMFIFYIKDNIQKYGFFQFLEFFLSGLMAGVLSIVVAKLIHYINVDKVIIGAIMTLVPGVAITNGIKDALYGDFISSFARLIEASFIAIAIGLGVGVSLILQLSWV